jgi:cytochrome P450
VRIVLIDYFYHYEPKAKTYGFNRNTRHMLHDPDVYADPMQFNPDRFKGDDVEMERAKDLVFGFGWRYCSGKDFAEGTLFAIIATTLAACDVLPGLDSKGKGVIPEYAYTNGLAMYMPIPLFRSSSFTI